MLTMVAMAGALLASALSADAAGVHACPAASSTGAPFIRAMLFFTTETPQNRALCHFGDDSVAPLAVGRRCRIAHVDLYADGTANGFPAGTHECRAEGQGPARCQITCEVSS